MPVLCIHTLGKNVRTAINTRPLVALAVAFAIRLIVSKFLKEILVIKR